MAGAEEQPHFPPETSGFVEIAQHVPLVGKRLIGSSSPAFVKLEWVSLPDVDPDSIAWADEVPGDPKAGWRPRGRRNATVIGVDRNSLGELGAHSPGTDQWAKDAVVCMSDGVVRIGTNPESGRLFGSKEVNGIRMFTLALRRGEDLLKATLGNYQPGEGVDGLFVPDEAFVVEPLVPIRDIATESPNSKLVG
jgi:hypothetical protein